MGYGILESEFRVGNSGIPIFMGMARCKTWGMEWGIGYENTHHTGANRYPAVVLTKVGIQLLKIRFVGNDEYFRGHDGF